MSRACMQVQGVFLCVILALFYSLPSSLAAEEYGFDLDAFEKKNFEWGGYAEGKWEHTDINQDGALAALNLYKTPRSTLDRFSGTLQLDGSFRKGITTLNGVVQASGGQDQLVWDDRADILEGYASINATSKLSFDMGKKAFKWGKGYAWNPVGFIARAKDPSNPEEALEGYIGAGVDLVKSYDGPLKTMALTVVALPVWEGVNEEFGETDNVNLAAKLYFLYRDTDIDLLWYCGNSRSSRYGLDFSKNMATNFEIHGEVAHVPEQITKVLTDTGSLVVRESTNTSYLLGIRYLTENDITSIVEFYHNDDGYTEQEMGSFFRLVDNGYAQFLSTASDALLQQAAAVSRSGYSKPQPGRDYFYARITQKEPFAILYLTPGLTAIVNLDDRSYTLSPEVVYSGFTNWEFRLRGSFLSGGTFSEYGEKQNSNKLELRIRSFF